jgi:hypothetical protein
MEYQYFLHYYSNKEWDCPICKSEKLPFILLNEEEYYMLLLENSTKTTYINKHDFQSIYTALKDTDFFNHISCTEEEEEENNKYLNGIDPDSNYKMHDVCSYVIDTNNLKINSNKELLMMTFNVRSIINK